jgi:hypothetical protein
MNFDGIFDRYNHLYNAIRKTEQDIAYQSIRLTQAEIDECRKWIYDEVEFMHYVIRGMRNFLKSPFK